MTKQRLRENICKFHVQRGHVFRIYKELSKFDSKKTNKPNKNWV